MSIGRVRVFTVIVALTVSLLGGCSGEPGPMAVAPSPGTLTTPSPPSNSEILGTFRKSYAHGFDGMMPSSRLLWRGRDKRGVWWAAVVVGPDSAGDVYAVCGYRKSRDRWVIQTIGNPDGSVLVNSDARPTPPAEVVTAMRRHDVPIIAP